MQQIKKSANNKSAQKLNAFVSVNSTWCTITDVKITFSEEEAIEASTEDIRALLRSLDDEKISVG